MASVALALIVLSAPGFPAPASAHETDENGGPPVFLFHGMPDTVLEVQVGADRRLKGLRFGQVHNLRAFAGTSPSFGFTILDTGNRWWPPTGLGAGRPQRIAGRPPRQ